MLERMNMPMMGSSASLKQSKLWKPFCIITFMFLFMGKMNETKQLNTMVQSTSSQEDVIHTEVVVERRKNTDANARFLNHDEIIIPFEDRLKNDEIVYAAFGSSSSWGAMLENREEQVYVRQLSDLDVERGKNFAIRATGPSYPAACASSMIGDDALDVIILEFYHDAFKGLYPLAKRLRERFPDAILVLISLWDVGRVIHKETKQSVADWAKDRQFGRDFIHDPKFHQVFLKEGGSDDDWFYRDAHVDTIKTWEKTAKDFGAYVYELPGDVHHAGGANGWLQMGDELLASDAFHLSEQAHADIANEVKKIVDRVGIKKERNLAKFISNDYCYSWLQDGIVDERLKYAPNVDLGGMPNTQKFALSFEYGGEAEGNWIDFENTSDERMEMSVSYMTMDPPPSSYPETEAIRQDNGEKYVLTTRTPVDWGQRKVHLTRLQNLGVIDPHKTVRVVFRPTEQTEWPFRLVQAMVIPENILTMFKLGV